MARTLLKEREKKALAARARMARRAKRNRFLKENKKRIILIFLAFLAVVFLAFFTPWGPDYYYSDIELRRYESPGVVTPGVCRDLYKLGWFYSVTFRKKQAQDMYNEIAMAYYGFKFTDYAANPAGAEEKRFEAERRKKRGESIGPPYSVADSDLPFVGLAMWRTGEMLMEGGPRDFPKRLFNDLYIAQFYDEHPEACDPKVTDIVRKTGQRLTGAR